MKKIFRQGIYIAMLIAGFSISGLAQKADGPTPPPPPKPVVANADDRVEIPEQSEIVIRQKGDKEAKLTINKLTIEIKDGNVFVDGKPLDQYDNKDIVIEKRNVDIDIAPGFAYGISPFRADEFDEASKSADMAMKMNSEMDMQRRVNKSIDIRMNAAFLGVSSKKSEKGGATVLEVTKGSPAEKAGIKKGDVITKLNDTKIESPENLFETVHNYKPGEKVKVGFTREGKNQIVTATLDKSEPKEFQYNFRYKMPPMPPRFDMDGLTMGPWGRHTPPKIGLKVQDAEEGKGLNVLEVTDSSSASNAGLKKGDIILRFNDVEVNNTNMLLDQMEEAREKPSVKVNILRGTVPMEMDIKIPRKLRTAEL